MFISGDFHVLGMRKPHFQCNTNREVATTFPRFCNEVHPLHVLFVKVVPGTIFTSWSKHHFVVTGMIEQQMCKASHCGTKQQWISYVMLILFLLGRATWAGFLKWLRVKETNKMQIEETWVWIKCNQTCWNNIGHYFLTYQAPFCGMLGAIS